MKSNFHFLAAILCLFSPPSFASNNLSALRGCYKSLSGKVADATLMVGNDMILLPGGKKGFYLYADKTVYFCDLPAQPHKQTSQYDHYLLDLKINDTKSAHLSYSRHKQDKAQPSMGLIVQPVTGVKYQPASCRPEFTEESQSLLASELESRMTSVYSTYLETNKSRKSKGEGEVSPEDFRNALNECSSVSELQEPANIELAKFPNATPAPVPRGPVAR